VLGVAGWQGAGKTSLLEAAIPALVASGLAVVVVKRHGHGGGLDVPGKDSDRLFRAGADVVLESEGEALGRWRPDGEGGLEGQVAALERRFDLVLVEGHKAGAHAKLWLLRAGEEAPPPEAEAVVDVLPWDGDRVRRFTAIVEARLAAAWAGAPRRAGILVGGASTRMGRPKERLEIGGEPLLARVARSLAAAGPLTLLGGAAEGASPGARPGVPRVPDAPGLRGPLAGILAAARWERVGWTIAACDLPRLDADAVAWLLAQRRPGRWVVLPRVDGVGQPLLAVYEPQALALLERIAAAEGAGPSRLEGLPHVAMPEPPPELADRWRGVNTPEELAAFEGS
jgi:molybdopterin-guanine dinucleotide biosynthesis protein MobB